MVSCKYLPPFQEEWHIYYFRFQHWHLNICNIIIFCLIFMTVGLCILGMVHPKTGLGSPRDRSWSLVILSVHKWHLIRYWVWNKTFCWWLFWVVTLCLKWKCWVTRKRIKKIHASYTLEGTNLENVESIKYLGVTITSDLRWNTHVSNVCTKANRTLGFLRRNLHSCPQEVKEAAYKGLVHPVLDYGSSVWDPPRCSSPGRIRKRAKARCQICDR